MDPTLAESMALVRRVVELGRAARATSGVRTRQPLGRALVSAGGWSRLSDDLRAEVCEELNVGAIETLADDTAGFVETTMKANFRALGQRFGKQTPLVAEAIATADPVALLADLRRTGSAGLHAAGVGDVEITEADVLVTETPREGWAVASEGGESLALDLHITDELQRAGTAREIVRAIQEARKQSGFDVSDRITVWWSSDDQSILVTLDEHAALIATEVLATAFGEGVDNAPEDAVRVTVPETDLRLLIARGSRS
jgi:isoleucyl-tRNA synthetase